MFQPFFCGRCDGQFRNVRLYRQHTCPARTAAVPSVLDRANSRYQRAVEREYRRTGRRERVLMV